VKKSIIASLIALLLSSCGSLKKKEVGPYGDKRSNWEKFRSYEEERYDEWVNKMTDPDGHRRREDIHSKKKNP
jgi:hypothetical protein